MMRLLNKMECIQHLLILNYQLDLNIISLFLCIQKDQNNKLVNQK